MFTMVVRRKYAWALCLMISTLMFSFSCNKEEEKEEGIESENLTIPVISSVEIRPEKPLSCEDLEAIVKIKGGADEEYTWWKNGNEITGEAGSTLGSESFFKGDSIEVEVIPSMRMIIDFGEKEPLSIMGNGGQSANLSSKHYDNMIEPWLKGILQPVPMQWNNILRQYKQKLVLMPK